MFFFTLVLFSAFYILHWDKAFAAELIISERFEGPYDLEWYDYVQWHTIPNFVDSGFNSGYGGAKSLIAKETNGCHSGSQCMKLYSPDPGGTSEFWTNTLSPAQNELWITWWEKLSSDYDINEGHK